MLQGMENTLPLQRSWKNIYKKNRSVVALPLAPSPIHFNANGMGIQNETPTTDLYDTNELLGYNLNSGR